MSDSRVSSAVMLACASHSPLMNYLQPAPEVTAAVHEALGDLGRQVAAFDPELVVVFGPDHFAGFFYDLMPPFCVGVRAAAMGDFGISTGGRSYAVPEEMARGLVAALHEANVDIAMSYRMQADHGFAQSLEQFAGGVGHYPTIPIFINCAAPPSPPMERVRRLGEGVGRFLATTGKRVLLVGSGGLSHDPPIPMLATAPAAVQEVLIAGHNPPPERIQGKVQRNIDTARAMEAGVGPAIPLNPQWDRRFMQLLLDGELETVARMDMAEAHAAAGVGVHEVRTWLAAFAALHAMGQTGPHRNSLSHYTPVPLWNAGFGILAVGGEAMVQSHSKEATWISA